MSRTIMEERNRTLDRGDRKRKENYDDPRSNRAIALKKIAELKKREIEMKDKKKVYKLEDMTVTVYGEGVELSIMDAPKEFDRIRLSLNPIFPARGGK